MEMYREETCQTAEGLIEALVKASEGGAGLFRGVSDATYTLTPTLYRAEGMARLYELSSAAGLTKPINPATPMPAQDWQMLRRQLDALMSDFFKIANRRNLIDLDLGRADFEALDPRAMQSSNWPGDWQFAPSARRISFPPDPPLPLLALMQHQGLPTPLLDWSEDLLTACFFATDTHPDKLGADIAVYTLNPSFFRVLAAVIRFSEAQRALNVPRLYYPSYRGNANLFAQAGAMTYVAAPDSIPQAATVPVAFDLRDALDGLLPGLDTAQINILQSLTNRFTPVLQKFTLPRAQVGALRARLRAFGVTASAIYPGFDGVRREIEGPG